MADSEISMLPALDAVTDETLLPVYQPGAQNPAQRMTGAQFREFAEAAGLAGAEPAVSVAQGAASTAADMMLSAQSAAGQAQSAAGQAQSSADRAEAAAERTESIIAPSEIVCTASGDVVAVKDSAERPLRGLNIYGKTTQDGMPDGTTAVPMNSVGADGAINVSVFGANFARGYVDVSSTNKGVTTKRHKDHAYVDISGTATGLISLALVGDYDQAKLGTKVLYLPAGTYHFVIPSEYARMCKYRKSATGTTIYNMSAKNVFTLTEGTWLSNIWVDITEGDVFPVGYCFHYGLYREGDVPAEWIDWQDGGNMTVNTPNGLPGVPVSSGGNYTDSNGQQWACDEIDFKRGVYIKRCAVDTVTVDSSMSLYSNAGASTTYEAWFVPCDYVGGGALSDKFPITTNIADVGEKDCLYVGDPNGLVFTYTDPNEYGFNFPMMLDVEGGISVIRGMRSDYWEETPLTAEQLAAYAALHSFYPATTVTNDESAGITIEYVADTKNYIDNKFAELKNALLGG